MSPILHTEPAGSPSSTLRLLLTVCGTPLPMVLAVCAVVETLKLQRPDFFQELASYGRHFYYKLQTEV